MVGSDVFHVHSEHELHVHEAEWQAKIDTKRQEMIQWQYENLDLVIPGQHIQTQVQITENK